METSPYAYLPEPITNSPSPFEKEGYYCTWYSKVDYPKEQWQYRAEMGGGWWRYGKLIPFESVNGPEEITFPNDPTIHMPQISWDKPTEYIKTSNT